ncbi:MAG TPA: BrnA antitoxin family protein [Bryobacteraceae bacterium]|jgi:uncharacterized protein (DUF4415 family)|nr:BrnA antitoxin family protein [Bryobacteraceae bacterium]
MKTKSVKISARTRELYEKRNKALDNEPDAPTLPLEKWERGEIGKFYRPIKEQITLRIDADVVDWFRKQGAGYQSRINDVLRREMLESHKKAS